MSDQSSQEPTMEEILASIRRIISEDDAPADAAAPEAAPEPAPDAEYLPEPVATAPAEDGEEVLDLVDPIPAPVETHGDLDVFSAPSPAPVRAVAPEPSYQPDPEPAYTPPPRRAPAPEADGLLSSSAAGAAASAFGSLSAAIAMPKDGRSLEDVTRELLRPLLKAWLDENLPRIVEAKVEEEVARIARLRG